MLDGVAQYQGGTSGISLTAPAAALGPAKSTVLRLIGPLWDEGLVHQDRDSGRYRLGPTVARLGAAFVARVDVGLLATDLLRELSKQTGEGASLVLPGTAGPGAGSAVLIATVVPGVDASAGRGRRTAESLRDRGWWAEVDTAGGDRGTVAAPVRDHRSRVVAAVESAVPFGRLRPAGPAAEPPPHLVGVGVAVRDCAAGLSDRLGVPVPTRDLAKGGAS